ncbi:MAG: dihydrolipoyl dehydrogenase [Pseudomonadota bacterium]|nr:dihydrolipoyl dehydrogenase [Pseudomonadota bacterium]
MNPIHTVDVAILGAGTAGMAAYRAAAAVTDRVVLIEADRYGTTCARVGCMPSKLLIAAADAAHAAQQAPGFGVNVSEVSVDGRRVMDRVRAERDRFVGFVEETVTSFPEHHRLLGRARFVDDHTLAVGDPSDGGCVVDARAIVIATGSRPRVFPFLEAAGDRLLVNDNVFDWTDLPASVAVFGPGVIGLELGQALHRLGVRVRMFGVGGFVGPLSDPEIRDEARRVIDAEVPLDPDARVTHVERVADGVRITWEENGTSRDETFDYVLATTGRTPNVDRLELENTTLVRDRRGVPVYDPTTLQCGTTGIFIAGDANADVPLLHEAADEGRIAGDNAARFPAVLPGLRRSPLSVVFTDPNIAMVGETWAQVKDRNPVIGRVSFEDQGRSRVMRQNRGRLNVYADRATGRFLGAEMIAPRAEHIGHLLAWAHQQNLTIDQMLGMPFYHPVIEEGLRTALRDASTQLAR